MVGLNHKAYKPWFKYLHRSDAVDAESYRDVTT